MKKPRKLNQNEKKIGIFFGKNQLLNKKVQYNIESKRKSNGPGRI
jgi:hypothetical protein